MIGNYHPVRSIFCDIWIYCIFSFVFSFYGIKQPVIFGQELVRPENDEKKDTERY